MDLNLPETWIEFEDNPIFSDPKSVTSLEFAFQGAHVFVLEGIGLS